MPMLSTTVATSAAGSPRGSPSRLGEARGGLLDAHADRRAHMQQDLAAVDLRERNCGRETASAGTRRATKPESRRRRRAMLRIAKRERQR
jgi:hypothetical protein